MSKKVLTPKKSCSTILIVQQGQTKCLKWYQAGHEYGKNTYPQLNSQEFRDVLLKKSQSASAHHATDATVQNRVVANPEATRLKEDNDTYALPGHTMVRPGGNRGG